MRNSTDLRYPVIGALLCVSASAGAQPAAGVKDTTSAPNPAVPDTRAESTTPDTGAARAEFTAGVTAYDERDYALAAKHFAKAQQLKPHPDVLLNLAQSELLAEYYSKAALHFTTYLNDTKNTDGETARAGLQQALTHVTAVTIETPAGSDVQLNGQSIGTAPLANPVFLEPGQHVLEAAGDIQGLETKAGAQLTVILTPEEQSGIEPAAFEEVPHVADTSHSGRKPFHEWYLNSPIAWVGTGLSAASFITSGIAAITASRSYGKANDAGAQIREQVRAGQIQGAPCRTPPLSAQYAKACSLITGNTEDGDTWSTVSIVSLVGGFVFGGATLGYYFIDSDAKQDDNPTAVLFPSFDSQGASVSLKGNF